MKIAVRASVALAVLIAGLFSVAAYQGHMQSDRLQRVAPQVSMTYDQLQAMQDRLASSNDHASGTANELIYLLACSGRVSTASALESMANAGIKLVTVKGMSERVAASTMLGMFGPADHALDGC